MDVLSNIGLWRVKPWPFFESMTELQVMPSVCHKPVACEENTHRITQFLLLGSPGTSFLDQLLYPGSKGNLSCEGLKQDYGGLMWQKHRFSTYKSYLGNNRR